MVGGTSGTTSNDPMPSWNDTPSKRAITAFVQRVHEPGYAKIVWTLRADPINATESVARTETRVTTTDQAARKAFRRYWSLVSPGVEVIRWVSLRLVKREAEGRIRRRQATVRRAALKDEPIHQASHQ